MAKKRLLREIARSIYGEELASKIWSRIDIVGDIAVIKKPFGLSVEELKPLAQALLERLGYVKSVWAATGPVEGPYRVRSGLVHLAGERRTTTLYKEHGCVFKVDISRVYISPRLSTEHRRVAEQVKPGEVVVNMYAGVGLFSIIIAKLAEPARVYSIDINPYAYEAMVENIKLNKVEDKVVPILGDAGRIVGERIRREATRILMPLPELALQHLPQALKALRGGGVVHIYLHVHAGRGESPTEKAVEMVKPRIREAGYKLVDSPARVVRMVGPRRYQVVVDAVVEEA